jgi:hypothetical protein
MQGEPQRPNIQHWQPICLAWLTLLGLFFVYAGDAPPGVNEAHYLVKAKNFWDPHWCQNDLFASSGKAHAVFYWVFGWPTQWLSLSTTAWIGRFVGWGLLAAGLVRLCCSLRLPANFAIVIALVWIAGVEQGNLAGEWVVGGIEAKVPAYAFVLFGIAELLQRHWPRVWLWFGSAAAFHVLTGGWAVVAGIIAFVIVERIDKPSGQERQRFFSLALVIGGAISLMGLLPALSMSAGASPAEATSAARVYTYFRISHHLLPSAFYSDRYVRHVVLSLVTLFLLWLNWRISSSQDRLRIRLLTAFAVGAMLISLLGLLVGLLPKVAPDLAAKLLRFYWFRLADAITPLVLGCAVAGVLFSRFGTSPAVRAGWLGSLAVLMAAVWFVGQSTWQRVGDGVPVSHSNRLLGLNRDASYAKQRETMSDWINVCRFVRANTPEDAVLLTPRHQQTFKWYAHRAEVVNWKDIPQDVASLRKWARRFTEVYPTELSTMRVTIRYDRLREFRERYGVDWMVVDRRVVGPHLPLVQVYPLGDERNATYAIYRLPSPVKKLLEEPTANATSKSKR